MEVLPPLPADAACVSGNASDLIMYAVAEQLTGRDARVICYRNETVKGINQRVHDTIHPGTLFGIGERVLCYFSAGAAGDKSPFKIVDDGGIPREHKARLMDEFTVMACNPADPDNNLPVMELILETSAGVIVKTLVPINRRAYEADIEKLWANYRSANTAFNLAQANTPEKEALRKEKTSLSGKAYAMINRYPDLRHAYAMTVHRSQGSTFDTALVHYADLNTMRSAFEFNRALYVACTRPRQYLAVVV